MILILIVVAVAVTYLAVSINESPESALLNAKKLLSRNVTLTYNFMASSMFIINNNVFPGISGIPFQTGPLTGTITISRTPMSDATVINGTLTFRHFIGGINFNLVLWKYDNELCYATEFNFMGHQTATHCAPYVNLTKYIMLTLNESKYVGKGAWHGKTTYCFTALITLTSTQGELQGIPIAMNVTKLCVLSNGVPTNITIYLYPMYQGRLSNMVMNINMTLLSYSFTFNQYRFSQITKGLIP
ncbi:hypothetical protein GCM10007112_02680 [Vulcanisaeta souniana JCM 11219]|uniref:Uncharacterized protein n=1 Tax=Vulcanisaeta souniana JCM 11219 TaxID=1293586 RepID=A0A830E457_9CREN|nr:hypothetical protein GCM10007112_02680 [Vulcanisaeta souniana JCM 11219]